MVLFRLLSHLGDRVEHHFTDDIQMRQYRCPEVILCGKWGTSVDMWGVACVVRAKLFLHNVPPLTTLLDI